MTLVQEAYGLIQEQPEKNLKLIIALLKTMAPKKEKTAEVTKRSGIANGTITFPDTFDHDFDAMDLEVAA